MTRGTGFASALLLLAGCSADTPTNGSGTAPVVEAGTETLSKRGVRVRLEGVPSAPVASDGSFQIIAVFENVPAGGGVSVSIIPIGRPERGQPRWGGGLSFAPLPAEGDGSVTFRFEGKAVSAPDDLPRFHPALPGEYRLVATVYSTQESWFTMIRPDSEALASYQSAPIILTEPGVTPPR